MKKTIKVLGIIIYWMIILFPFSIAIAPGFTGAVMGIMFVSFIAKQFMQKEKFAITTVIDRPYLFLLIFSLISIIHSLDYAASIKGVFRLVQNYMIVAILVAEIKDKKHIKRIISAIIAGGVLASLDAFWQVAFGTDFIRGHAPHVKIGLTRAIAAFPNPNVLGVYLVPLIFFAFGLGIYYYRKRLKWLLITSGIIMALGIILTYSRPAGLAFFLGLFVMAVLKKDKKVITVLLCLFVLSAVFAPRNIKDWARHVKYNPVIFMCNYDRISIYRNAINMIKHHPLIGCGLNTFSQNYYFYKLPEVGEEYKTGDSMYAHNNFLHMAGEIGILGLGMFLWLLARFFIAVKRTYRKLKDGYLKIVCLSCAISVFGFLVNGMTETSLYYSRVAMIFWYIIGLALFLTKFAHSDG